MEQSGWANPGPTGVRVVIACLLASFSFCFLERPREVHGVPMHKGGTRRDGRLEAAGTTGTSWGNGFFHSHSHGYSGEDRNVLVEGVVLEHALGDENLLNLPQHVLPQVPAQYLTQRKEEGTCERMAGCGWHSIVPPCARHAGLPRTSLMVAPPCNLRGLM